MPYFIFLEFSDPNVHDFLNSLRNALTGKTTKKIPHVTVRGPYETRPDNEILEQVSEKLCGYGVVIGGAGIFETSKGYAVYLRVQSPVFSEIWWKPDFKIGKFGLNPHVTIYETKNRAKAKAVEIFLRTERIEIFTFSLELTVYASSKQLELFDADTESHLPRKRVAYKRWNVKPGILHRATSLQTDLKQRNDSDS